MINISQQERHALERTAHIQHKDTTIETLTKAWAKTLAEPTKPKTYRRGIVGWKKSPRPAPIKPHRPKPTQLHAIREKAPAEANPSELIQYGVAPLSLQYVTLRITDLKASRSTELVDSNAQRTS